MNGDHPSAAVIGHEVIAASAGTGKTFQLALRYLRLLSLGVAPERIVALTFSRKAAGEIFAKIVQRLVEWIERPEIHREQAGSAGMRPLAGGELTAMLRRLLLASHQLRIGTLDSFYVAILRAFPFEFGIGGEFAIDDGPRRVETRAAVLACILQERAGSGERGPFLEAFKQATFGREEKALLRHLHDFVEQHHQLFLELPEGDAWGEADRIWPEGCAILSARQDDAALAEFSKLLANINLPARQHRRWEDFMAALPEFNPATPLPGEIKYILDRTLPQLADLGRRDVHLPIERGGHELPMAAGRPCRRLLLHLLQMVYAYHLERTRGVQRFLRLYEEAYHRHVRSTGRMTFQDVQFLLSPLPGHGDLPRLCRDDPGPDRLYLDYRLDGRFDHWLLDEFQDTSLAQWLIVANLIDEVMQDATGRRSFFYVGDTKQSVYGWRGGDARLFHAVRTGFQERYGNLSERPLNCSYRSSPTIIAAVNHVFTGLVAGELPEPLPAAVARFGFRRHSTAREDLPGHARLIEFAKDSTIGERTRWIGEEVQRTDALAKGLSVAVLVRQNQSGASCAEQLHAMGLPVVLEGDAAVADNPLAAACLSLARLADHPGDEFAWQHLLMTPLRDRLTAWPSRAELCRHLLGQIHDGGFHGLLRAWLDAVPELVGDDPFLRRRSHDLLAAARRFDQGGNRDAIAFASFIAGCARTESAHAGAVRILTIHKAKGLEFDLVFAPELKGHNLLKAKLEGIMLRRGPERLPLWAMQLPRRDLAEADPVLREFIQELDEDQAYEQLCVLYVAMTRARRALYLMTGAPSDGPTALYLEDLVRMTLGQPDDAAPTSAERRRSSPQDAADTVPTVLWQDGDDAWLAALPVRPDTRQRPPVPALPAIPARRQTATPSGAEPALLTDAAAWFAGDRDRPLELGSAIHELLAAVAWSDDPDFAPRTVIENWRRTAAFPETVLATAAKMFLAAMAQPEIRNALARPSDALDLWREQRFDVMLADTMVAGCFDRVVWRGAKRERPAAADILDFKSDHVADDAELAVRVAAYTPQMRLYRRALAVLAGLPEKHITAQLLFVNCGKVVTIES